MNNEPLSILGVKFPATVPNSAAKEAVAQFIIKKNEPSFDEHFECPFYKKATIVQLFPKNIMPPGLDTVWLCDGKELLHFAAGSKNLDSYNSRFGLTLNDRTVDQYAAFVFSSVNSIAKEKLGGINLRKPMDLDAINNAGVTIKSLVNVEHIHDGWIVRSYFSDWHDHNVVEVDFKIGKDGSVDHKLMIVKRFDEKVRPMFLMM